MILVLSHAWTLDEGEHRDAYIRLTDEFEAFHRAQPGFRGRRLVRDDADGRHFLNLRWWDALEDYERMVADPDYPGWIDRLSEHVEARDPQKSTFLVVVDHDDPAITR
ncbi:MAG TPA: antibiotic biosynthesis monooxygenase [Microthrixaceae bacterium]|nr:antibiotic biosynthesis monooxygenase [Microthrixaceae bacterium]